MLSRNQSVAIFGLKNVSKIGCLFKLTPYSWNERTKQLVPAGKYGKAVFSFHTYCNYITAFYAVFRLMQSSYEGTFSFMTSMWYIPILSVTAGFSAISHHQQDVLQFVNMLNSQRKVNSNKNRTGKF